MLLQNQLGMIRKNIIPEPTETNIVDKNKYFDTEKDLTLDEMMSKE